MQTSFKNVLTAAQLSFDTELAQVLGGRPDLSYEQIGQQFEISETVIRRVIKKFNIKPRKRGPKTRSR